MRYVILDIWEEYGYTPQEWDEIDKQTQLELISKRRLDRDHEEYLKEEAKND